MTGIVGKPNRGQQLASKYAIYRRELLTLQQLITSTESMADDLSRVRNALSLSIEAVDELGADRCIRKIAALEPRLADTVRRVLKLHEKVSMDFRTLETLVGGYLLSHTEDELTVLLGGAIEAP